MLWYCGSIFHEVLYFIQIGNGDTVKLSGKKSGSIEIESDLQAFLDQLENSDHNKARSISSRTYWIKGEKSYIHISVTCIINILRNFQFRKSCQLMPDELKVDYVFFRERLESNISMKSSLSIRFKAAAIQCGNRTYKSLVHSGVLNYFYVFLVHPLHYPYIYYYNSYFFIA